MIFSMRSRVESTSRLIWWAWASSARLRISDSAPSSSSSSTSGWITRVSSGGKPACTLNQSRPTRGSVSSASAASFRRSYSCRRRISSARGSSSSSPSALGGRGSSVRDLISASMAAISRYSPASSISMAFISSTYSMYWWVMVATLMVRISRFCRRIKYSSRSSGPSNASRKTRSASGGI